MSDLILYLGITVVGYGIGAKLRNMRDKLHWTGNVQTVAMVLLIIFMGMRMGSNQEIINNISTIGVSAFLMTVAVLAGSIGAIFVTRKLLGIDRYGMLASERI